MLYILLCSYLLPVLLIVFYFRKSKKEFNLLGIYCICIFILNLFFDPIVDSLGRSYYIIYTFIEYLTFAFIIWHSVEKNRLKKLIVSLSVLFVAFQVIYFFTGQKKLFDSVPIGVETIFILVFIFFFFHEQLNGNNPTSISKNHFFWINIGILIYLSGTFFFYMLVNHLPVKQIQPYWYITYLFDIIKNVMLAIGIYIFMTSRKTDNLLSKKIPHLDF